MSDLNYFDAADVASIRRDYPLGAAFLKRFQGMSVDELRHLQNQRFMRLMAFAWQVPFYQRHWGAAGLQAGDVKSLDDITRIPMYSKSDLMASVEAHPPLGDFHGQDVHPVGQRPPIIVQTTSGTTGMPQPLLFGPRSRETQNALLARVYLLQGMSAQDVVHSVYGFGMVNGGHYIRETLLHWVGAQMLSAGTGVETRSQQQVMLMRDFKATVLVGFGDFVKRLSDVAKENGIEPGRDIRLRMITGHLGPEGREPMSQAWGGCDVYDWYGVGDTGLIAGESQDQTGMYIMEDAQFLEITHTETGAAVAPGEPGNMVNTCLFKDDIFPIIRFNTNDVTHEVMGSSPMGLPFRRIIGFKGRSDNMIKLRGINVYPTSVGVILTQEVPAFNGEFVCIVTREAGRDQMTVHAEMRAGAPAGLQETCQNLLRARLGVELAVVLAQPGEIKDLTGIESRQKPLRLVDRR